MKFKLFGSCTVFKNGNIIDLEWNIDKWTEAKEVISSLINLDLFYCFWKWGGDATPPECGILVMVQDRIYDYSLHFQDFARFYYWIDCLNEEMIPIPYQQLKDLCEIQGMYPP